MVKRILEYLRIVRLVWLTESWKDEGYRTVLRIVRFQGPDREPWCWNTGECNNRVRLLADGTCKSRYRCSWQSYNERSPKPAEIYTRDHLKVVEPIKGAWAA